jgi:hypothetical protein
LHFATHHWKTGAATTSVNATTKGRAAVTKRLIPFSHHESLRMLTLRILFHLHLIG